MGLFDSWDEIIENDLRKFDEFKDVDKIVELLTLLKGLRKNKEYKKMSMIATEDMGKKENTWRFDESKIPFLNAAKKGLGFTIPFLYLPPLTKFIDYDFLIATYSIIQFSYIYHSDDVLNDKEYKSIILGDIGPNLTYFVEDYDKNLPLPDYSIDFFKRLKNVNWADKKAKKLEHIIYNEYLTSIESELGISSIFVRTYLFATLYLMGCSALKDDRDVITCEDVVVSFLTTFKLMFNDVRPLIPFID